MPALPPIPRLVLALLTALALHAVLLPGGASLLQPPPAATPEPPPVADAPPAADPAIAAPDLTVGQTWSPPRLAAGVSTRVRARVWNTAATAATPPSPADSPTPDRADAFWLDAVFVSRDEILDEGDLQLVAVPRRQKIPGGASYDADFEVTLPDALAPPDDGTGSAADPETELFLLFVADAAHQIDEAGREANNLKAVPFVPRRKPVEPETAVLGRDDVPPNITVAWISHDAFEQLRAADRRTHQPAVQSRTDPTPGAPARATTGAAAAPAPPTRSAPPTAMATPSPPRPTPTPNPSRPPTTSPTAPAAALPPPPVVRVDWADYLPGVPKPVEAPPAPEVTPNPPQVAVADTAPTEPEQTHADRPTTDPPTDPTPEVTNNPAESPPRPPSPPTEEPDLPTSRPRDLAEADASDLIPVPIHRPGAVEVSPGLRVTTSRPEFKVTALVTTVPRDTTARVTFDTDGVVIDAVLLNSTGSIGFDAPLRASLYRWRASGEPLQEWDGPRTFTFKILWPH